MDSEQVAFLFPGQGAQQVGMGAELYDQSPAARAVYDAADHALNIPLSRICFDGPADDLNDTQWAQPGLLATSIAMLAALQERRALAGELPLQPAFVAGHSLGEWSALVASGAAGFTDVLRLVWDRGRLMKQAGEQSPGGMAAVMRVPADQLAAICTAASDETGTIVVPANVNTPEQIVISGAVPALERAMELAKEAGGRVTRLAVSIASHSPLMAAAATEFAALVAALDLNDPAVPLIGNISGAPLTTATALRDELSGQLLSPVQWVATVQTLVAQGVTRCVEIGPGNVLAGLGKPTAPYLRVVGGDATCRGR
jgi:[acyl-carrier-protein] S-malonyltransferase